MVDVSLTTQAILMLVAPLLAGGRTETGLLLTPKEYTRLAQVLRQLDSRPSDLLGSQATGLLDTLANDFDRDRLGNLLARGMQVSLALEQWQQLSIQVISRADSLYPRRLKKSLGYRSPPLLYFCGNPALLNGGGLAVVGSRQVDTDLLEYTCELGALAATAGCTIVSGGAKGIDQASMQGAATAGGKVVGVLAHDLARAVMQRDNRNALMNHELLLCSPFDPAAGFKVWQAMDRNKLIYALADVALVVQSDVGKGGTWSGAREQIQKFRCVPVYTRTSGPHSPGLAALRDLGADSWPEPHDVETFRAVVDSAAGRDSPGKVPIHTPKSRDGAAQTQPDTAGFPWADKLQGKVEDLLLRLLVHEPASAQAIADCLEARLYQVQSWLKHLVEAGKLTKSTGPVRYQVTSGIREAGSLPIAVTKGRDKPNGASPSQSPQPDVHMPNINTPIFQKPDTVMWADELRCEAEDLLLRLFAHEDLTVKAVAETLQVSQIQAKQWLEPLVAAGKLTKASRPLYYQRNTSKQQTGLL
ncbi:MAG: DNA-processing protein DprA [Caldilineaceae bacterium SB0662_bin_9]|uniref:DNA-processing protein DprA n=1 Tax=Caldilineaceae bacterium SB0662_bin_9 TaxID=2605258 RepID=A0A6B1DVS2_9CHLR|nr:DNA-processing protein DprA [Caldilineaceae bacterium SB0662_bin_9]